jgi:excisionase family DNA binding protein
LKIIENQHGRLAYKLNEASALLGVSVITIRRAIDRGLIKPSRAFRHVLIPATELQSFLDKTSGTGKEGA